MADGSTGDKLVNSVVLTLIARLAMVIAAGALPIAGWMLQRGINSVDEVSRKIDGVRDQTMETSGTMRLIQQTIVSQGRQIDDHELRIRGFENLTRGRPN